MSSHVSSQASSTRYWQLSDLAAMAAIALSYLVLAYIALTYFAYNGVISLVWPSSGLALAALLLGGKKLFPGVFVGAFMANLLVGGNLLVASAIAFGNTVEALLAVWLLLSVFSFDDRIMHPKDYLYLSIAGAGGVLLGAANGTITLLMADVISTVSWPQDFLNWWMGDMLGILMMTPLILIWRYMPRGWLTLDNGMEFIACFGGAMLSGQVIFLGWFDSALGGIVRDYWAFFFVSWSAIRFGTHGALLVIFITSVQALAGVVLKSGYLQELDNIHAIILNLWFYVFALTMVGVSLSLVIHARNKSEEKLRDSYERYRLVVENAPYGIHEIDKYGVIKSMNPAGLKMLNLHSIEEVDQEKLQKTVMPEDRERIKALFDKAGQGEQSRYELTSSEGRVFQSCFVPISNKEFGYIIGITEDITERKKIERLEASRAEIMQLIANDADAESIFHALVDGVEKNNPSSLCSVLLLDDDGLHLKTVMAPSLPDFYNQAIDGVAIGPDVGSCGAAAYTGERVVVEDIQVHPNWRLFKGLAETAGLRSCWSQPFRSANGNVLGTFAIYHRYVAKPGEDDIKQIESAGQLIALVIDRIQAQQKLKELNRTLEKKVNERTFDLEQAKHTAELATEAKSEFLSHMSHEIRTPLNSVIGMSYLALKTATDTRQKDYLQKILWSGEHLLEVINDILDLSKIEAGMLVIDKVAFNIAKVKDRISTLFNSLADEKNIRLVIDFNADIPEILTGDLQHINQVLVNLVGNSLKFTRTGQVAVTARLLTMEAQHCVVCFEVKDTGIGMSDEQVARLFQPFVQGDSSITREHGGTGLGLTICKQLVEMMGGAITVQSRINEGSVFSVNLPFDIVKDVVIDEIESIIELSKNSEFHNKHILLAEDNRFNQQVGKEMLVYLGANVVIASNGAEALDLLVHRHLPIDCILMDMQMPVMDGLDATRIIRSHEQFAALPVIAMTANLSQKDYDACFKAGMNDFIAKPVTLEKLQSTLSKWITGVPK